MSLWHNDDLVRTILSFVAGPRQTDVRDVLTVSTTCTRLRDAVRTMRPFWKMIYLRLSHRPFSAYYFDRIMSCYNSRWPHDKSALAVYRSICASARPLEPLQILDRVRASYGECTLPKHRHHFQVDLEDLDNPSRDLYKECMALAFKRFAPKWSASKTTKLHRLEEIVQQLKQDRVRCEVYRTRYQTLVDEIRTAHRKGRRSRRAATHEVHGES